MKLGGAALAAGALLCLAGCQKGCLSEWLAERGATREPGKEPASRAPNVGRGQDCPDGLARCSGGAVQVSRLYTYPIPCEGPPERCQCPWDNVAGCERGCVADGYDFVMAKEHAPAQLCAPRDLHALAAPPPKDLVFAQVLCTSTSYVCSQGVVALCTQDGNVTAVAACVHGCADPDTEVEKEGIGEDQAIAILCSRPPGEGAFEPIAPEDAPKGKAPAPN